MDLKERQKIIAKIKRDIDSALGVDSRIDHASTGRKGTLVAVNVPKKGMKSVSVLCDREGRVLISVDIGGKGSDDTSPLIQDILKNKGYVNVKPGQKNPRYEYSLARFEYVYNLLTNHDALEDASIGLHTPAIFDKLYSPKQIINRYLNAFKDKDQDALNYARHLMAADLYDTTIAINSPSPDRGYREHIVPCILIHKEIINRIQQGIKDAQAIGLPSLVSYPVIQDLEKLVADNLKIAYIDPKDAARLDGPSGLRTTMPAGWNWGDSPTARLDVNNIPY
jgi:hypothetical protein